MPRVPAPHLVLHNFLTTAEHRDLLSWTLANQSRFKAAGVGGAGVNTSKRNCLKLPDVGPLQPVFQSRVESLFPDWLRQLRVTPFVMDKLETEIVAYADGAHFAFHMDAALGKDVPARNRRLTAVYYFFQEPQPFTGGDLRLFDLGSRSADAEFTVISPQQNAVVVFPSWVGHDVTPVHCSTDDFVASRFAVNCWIHQPG